MSGNTSIEWAQKVWNPVLGCTKIAEGCKNCYAKRLHDMRHQAYQSGKRVSGVYAKPFEKVWEHDARLDDPFRWKSPSRVFVNSMSDLFHDHVSRQFLARVFAVMAQNRQHTFMILTKRARRLSLLSDRSFIDDVMSYFWREAVPDWQWPLPNVWLGISVSTQEDLNNNATYLLQTPAAVHFVSAEPLLEEIMLHEAQSPYDDELFRNRQGNIDWVICGGESGPGARPMHLEWARSLRDQCSFADVPFFFKGWGEWLPEDQIWMASPNPKILNKVYGRGGASQSHYVWADNTVSFRIGKKMTGRQLDEREWSEFPGGTK